MSKIGGFFELIGFIFILILTTIQGWFMYGGYKPTGEVYAKTSPTSGDAGIIDVIDFEMEHQEYTLDDEIYATIGFGHKEDKNHGTSSNFTLKIEIFEDVYEEKLYDEIIINYNEPYDSDKFSAYSEKSYLDFLGHYWYWYPDFYPNYKEEVRLNIPNMDYGKGCIKITTYQIYETEEESYENAFVSLKVFYHVLESENGKIVVFNAKK